MRFALPVVSLLLVLFSCGTMPGHGAGQLGDAGLDAGPVDAGPVDAGPVDAGPVDAGAAVVASPVVTAVTLVTHGTIAVSWQLPAAGCSNVLVGMKVGLSGTFSTVQTLSGAAAMTQHSPGHGSGTYCYRVVCARSGLTSEPSNEKCASQ